MYFVVFSPPVEIYEPCVLIPMPCVVESVLGCIMDCILYALIAYSLTCQLCAAENTLISNFA